MRSALLIAALAAGCANAYDKRVYVTDWTTVTVTETVMAPAVTETIPAVQQDRVVVKTSTETPFPVETTQSDFTTKSTVIVPEAATSTTVPAPEETEVYYNDDAATSYFSTAWTSTIAAYSTLATSTSSSTEAASTGATVYQQHVLYNHNIHRSNHSVSSLEWSADLEASAQILAARCVYEHDT